MRWDVRDVERALIEACRRGHAEIIDFTVAPPGLDPRHAGDDWLVEFAEPPRAPETFVRVLDEALQRLDADYRAQRASDPRMRPPRVLEIPAGTFYRWARRNAGGGVASVPRITDDRTLAEELLALVAARTPLPPIAVGV